MEIDMNNVTINYDKKELLTKDINMIDCDPGWALCIMDDLSSKEAMIKSACDFMDDKCVGTEVTDIAFSVFMQTSFVDCESMGWVYRDSAKKIEEWIARGDEEGEPFPLAKRIAFAKYPNQYHAFEKYGIDWAQIAVDECKKRGVRPWLYFRMNDLHAVDQDDSIFHDPFFFKARENGWLIGNTEYGRPMGTSGRIENVYDYSHAEVREWLLTYIEEIMMRYDVYGYGLDFMRNIYCFDYLRAEPGYQEYMNDFMRRVRDIANRAGEKHGHDIKLLACVTHTVEDSFIYGFDVKTWAKESLVDIIVPRCEEVCNSGVDMKEWRDAVGDDIALLIGYDDHISRWADAGAEYIYQITPEQLKGFCAKYFNTGANGLYFNNYFAPSQVNFGKDMGRKMASEGTRTFVVTHQDIIPIGRKRYKPLPFSLGSKIDFDINMGVVREDEHLYVTVGYDSTDVDSVTLKVNGKDATTIAPVEIEYNKFAGHYYDDDYNLLKSAALIRYGFDKMAIDGDFTVTFDGGEGINVVYLEATATPDELK